MLENWGPDYFKYCSNYSLTHWLTDNLKSRDASASKNSERIPFRQTSLTPLQQLLQLNTRFHGWWYHALILNTWLGVRLGSIKVPTLLKQAWVSYILLLLRYPPRTAYAPHRRKTYFLGKDTKLFGILCLKISGSRPGSKKVTTLSMLAW